ncbi:hypothetical protein MO973_31475 [Paenibacillus sp. TRM 82003]|nr:hypothetical protein [Paenibacillus sp. TRM 82003]
MSIASISYGSLKDASGEAKDVAKKLDRYADALHDSVYKKLNSYGGSWSSNLTTAKSKVNDKISALRAEEKKYEAYAADLIDLKERCQAVDKSVRAKVSSLTATFKDKNNITTGKVDYAINYILTNFGNSTSLGRWLSDGKDKIDAAEKYLWDAIEEWYDYEGGKEWLKGTAIAALEIAIGVVAIIGAIATGGALILVIAGVVGGAIAIANGLTNLVNEQRAYHATLNDDPATGKRRSSLDTLTNTIQTESDSRLMHHVAAGIDAVNTVCMVVTAGVAIAGNVSNLLKNGYKWATGNVAAVDSLKLRDILTKHNFNAFTGKLKTSVVEGWTEVSSAVRMGNWTFLKTTTKDFGTDFANNFKGKYMDFSTIDKRFESAKSIMEATSDLIKDGLNFKSIGKIAFPVVPVANLPGGGNISVGDFSGIYDDSKKMLEGVKSQFDSKDTPIKAEVLDKLSAPSATNASTPNSHIPDAHVSAPKTITA